ncbi:hypothetical protein JOB18_034308 [Solea senegalensis]|uniref:Uncharacterized protein n=1 Tax=Solea senegalensis TaxID=28829 RepID=A0AAV6PAW3_SOLSE|nr:hypothetical protein JOB18_034308 [Solea senegalensis]
MRSISGARMEDECAVAAVTAEAALSLNRLRWCRRYRRRSRVSIPRRPPHCHTLLARHRAAAVETDEWRGEEPN